MMMEYKGKPYTPRPVTREKFKVAYQDAERIMGLRPTLKTKDWKNPQFLEPPEEGSTIWNYAQHVLSLEWPVVQIWKDGDMMVNQRDLKVLAETVYEPYQLRHSERCHEAAERWGLTVLPDRPVVGLHCKPKRPGDIKGNPYVPEYPETIEKIEYPKNCLMSIDLFQFNERWGFSLNLWSDVAKNGRSYGNWITHCDPYPCREDAVIAACKVVIEWAKKKEDKSIVRWVTKEMDKAAQRKLFSL